MTRTFGAIAAVLLSGGVLIGVAQQQDQDPFHQADPATGKPVAKDAAPARGRGEGAAAPSGREAPLGNLPFDFSKDEPNQRTFVGCLKRMLGHENYRMWNAVEVVKSGKPMT